MEIILILKTIVFECFNYLNRRKLNRPAKQAVSKPKQMNF